MLFFSFFDFFLSIEKFVILGRRFRSPEQLLQEWREIDKIFLQVSEDAPQAVVLKFDLQIHRVLVILVRAVENIEIDRKVLGLKSHSPVFANVAH